MEGQNAYKRFDILLFCPSHRTDGPPDDVLDVIDQMIKSVDSVEGSTNSSFILPDIQHWNRIFRILRDSVVEALFIPSAVAGAVTLTLVTAVVLAPVVVSRKIAQLVSRMI